MQELKQGLILLCSLLHLSNVLLRPDNSHHHLTIDNTVICIVSQEGDESLLTTIEIWTSEQPGVLELPRISLFLPFKNGTKHSSPPQVTAQDFMPGTLL